MKENFLKNKKVTVMGLGLIGGGVGVVEFLVKAGAKVLVTDLKTKKELKKSLEKIKGLPVELVLGKHRPKDFIKTDLVIKNPGVREDSFYLEIARKHDVAIETDIGIFFELCKAPIIGVTGTKGKSTVATLIHHLIASRTLNIPGGVPPAMKKKYPRAILAGNIGTSPLEFLDKITKKSRIILEISDSQMEGLKKHKKGPKIAVITNIFPDHLNRYKTFKEYIETKRTIFQFQKPKDILLLNYDNKIVRDFWKSAKSRVYFFSQKEPPKKFRAACFLKDEKIFFGKEKKPICSIRELKIKGEHNISNILSAISTAKLLKIPPKDIKAVLKEFKGVSFRQEFIGEIRGVKYFNDTTATMPQASQAAIRTLRQSFPKAKIILIAGGVDKNLDYKNLAKEIEKNIEKLILFSGTASDKIKKELSVTRYFREKRVISNIGSMEEAVKTAAKTVKKGDIVVLSPGAASFNLFKNEFDRGEQFNKAVKSLKKTINRKVL